LRIVRTDANQNSDAAMQCLEVQIAFAQNLLSHGYKLPPTSEKFMRYKCEYQKLVASVLRDAQRMPSRHKETRQALATLLAFAKYLLEFAQLNESYKVYHCMRKMCDDTQINLDLQFMTKWIEFVKLFIAQIVAQNRKQQQQGGTPQRVLWSEQILELCEFDVKVLEKISAAAVSNIDVGTDVYAEYIACANALIAVNVNRDQHIIDRCKHYLNQASKSEKEQITKDAMRILNSLIGC